MRRLGLVVIAALVAVSGAFTEEPANAPDACELRLHNGSIIRGTLKGVTEVTLKTKGAKKTFALKDVWSVKWGVVKKEELDCVLSPEGAFEGELADVESFEIDTGFGTLKIPVGDVVQLRMVHPGKGISFDFAANTLAGWTPLGKAEWSASGGAVHSKSSTPGDMLLLNADIDGDFTIEADITSAGWAALVFHVTDHEHAEALWMIPGNAGLYGNPDWKNSTYASWSVATTATKPVHAVVEVKANHARVTMDGKFVGEADLQETSGRIGLASWSSEVTFDNFRLTR
ncbi:MAG: DUF1080 domain-containing protein [Planctomycetes bacterium]|nr:DUF1080 domain-containing protein [Planctomycetota bacterium]